MTPAQTPAALVEARDLVAPKVLGAAWGAWRVRHKGQLGPGPAFTEAVTAGVAVALATERARADALAEENERLEAEKATLLRVIDAGKAEVAFAMTDEAAGCATDRTRRARLNCIGDALKGIGDSEARNALGLLVETIDGELARTALTKGPRHDQR